MFWLRNKNNKFQLRSLVWRPDVGNFSLEEKLCIVLSFLVDIDDFIVDDDGQPIKSKKKKKHIIHADS